MSRLTGFEPGPLILDARTLPQEPLSTSNRTKCSTITNLIRVFDLKKLEVLIAASEVFEAKAEADVASGSEAAMNEAA